jgi:hypothetical protein
VKVLIWGMGIFFISLILHLIVWRISVPGRGMKVLLQIFFGTLTTTILFLCAGSAISAGFGSFAPDGVLGYVHVSIFFSALALAYTITYSAIEADSPSIGMIMKIAGSGADGLPEGEFEGALTDDVLIRPRIEDLINDELIFLDKDIYRLTAKGATFIHPFIMYRKLLNLQKGG